MECLVAQLEAFFICRSFCFRSEGNSAHGSAKLAHCICVHFHTMLDKKHTAITSKAHIFFPATWRCFAFTAQVSWTILEMDGLTFSCLACSTWSATSFLRIPAGSCQRSCTFYARSLSVLLRFARVGHCWTRMVSLSGWLVKEGRRRIGAASNSDVVDQVLMEQLQIAPSQLQRFAL